MTTAHKKIAAFLVLTFAFSSIPYYFIISAGETQAAPTLALMWCPGIAAIITQLAFHRSLRGLGWKPGKPKYLLVGYLVPVTYGLVSYVIIWLTGLGRLDTTTLLGMIAPSFPGISSPATLLIVYLGVILTLGTLQSILSAAGEEIGWRGLLVPALSKVTSFTGTALISGAIWTVWHYPILLFGGYNNPDAPLWFGLICFTVMVMGVAVIAAWLRLKTGSMWPAILLHASHNLFIQNVFTPLTANTGLTPYFIDEFGVMLAVVIAIAAYILWRRRGELEPAEAQAGLAGVAAR